MRIDGKQLGEGQLTLIIDLVPCDGVGQLGYEIHVSRIVGDQEGGMSGTRTGSGHEGVYNGPGETVLVDLENPHKVRAQVWDDDVLSRGVEDSLVRVRSILTIRVGTRLCEGEGLILDRCQCSRVGYREGAEARTGAVCAIRYSCSSKFGSPLKRADHFRP